MTSRFPHVANTRLFRISAVFLLLLAICLGGYYLWVEHTVFNPFANRAEENWYKNLAADELDSLATRLAATAPDRVPQEMLRDYGRTVESFGVDLVVFGNDGRYLWSSAPDSLGADMTAVDASLLREMSADDWDFGSYPDSLHADAYLNRIFDVNRVIRADGASVGYLAANYGPMAIVTTDLNADSRKIDAQTLIFKILMGLLIYSAVSALLIMAWTRRRVQRLSAGVAAFSAGDLSRRVRTRSTDEIGTLGRNFNAMAERIEGMVEKLRQKEQFQRQLIANVSHDLRTPMASMRGYVETLQMDGGHVADRDRDRYLEIIAGNLDHLDRLVEHMLILSRFDSGQATFRLEDFPVAELAESVLTRCEGLADKQDVSLELTVEPQVELVRADPLQIGQVLQNLVENAIKFNRPGGRVTIAITRREDRVELGVRDTGRGIPAEHLPRIFDRFFTGDESRTRQAGDQVLGQSTGLGLSIAARIVSGHGARLQVASRVDVGTEFSFRLPHVQADAQETAGGD